MSNHKCVDCGTHVEPARHAIRLVGKDARGNIAELCGRCFLKRGVETRAVQQVGAT